MDFYQTELRRNGTDISSALAGDQQNDGIMILGEIVGATNLVAAKRVAKEDIGNSDHSSTEPTLQSNNAPQATTATTYVNSYCVVYWGEDVIHETKVISRNNNPIWSCDTGSLFLFHLLNEEYSLRGECLRIEVYDKVSKKEHEFIGEVILEGSKFAHNHWCDEKRRTFELIKERIPDSGQNEESNAPKRTLIGKVSSLVTEGFTWLDDSWRSQRDLEDEIDDEDSIYGKDADNSVDETEIDDDFVFGRTGTLALRFRVASEDDKNFLKAVKIFERGYKYAKRKGTNQTLLAGVKMILDGKSLAPLVTESSSSVINFCTNQEIQHIIDYRFCGKVSDKAGVERYRVKPFPNPNRNIVETQYLTEAEMLELAYKPSTNWVEAGSGTLGRIYVEILSCQRLPNKNVGKAFGNKADPFVCLIYEDCLVQTDVVRNCQNPLFMPWTQRAFVFNTMNTLSCLYLGVFDHDFGPFNHKGMGRVTVDLRELKQNTEYTLKYNLYTSPMTSNRKIKGSITLRIQVVQFSDKQSLLSMFNPPIIHVNVKRRKTLEVARFTCYGKYREDVYNMKILRGFIDEFFEYLEQISSEISYSLDSLLFWRGQVSFFNVELPLYSAAVYFSAIYVIERPRLIPSYFFFCCGWILLAISGNRSDYPAPLYRSKSFLYYMSKMLLPSNLQKYRNGENIGRFEGLNKAEEMKKKKLDRKEANKKFRAQIAHVRREMQLFLASLSDLSLHTSEDGFKYNPLSRLLPIQLLLKELMFFIRCAKLILCSDDSAISFVLTLCCFSVSFVLFWLPSGRIFHWFSRVFVWIIMGPWMRCIEIIKNRQGSARYLQKKMDEMKEREQKRLVEARILKEEALKLKATRVLRFGRFAIRVPFTNLTRYRDQPLPESYANKSEVIDFDNNSSIRSFMNVSNYIPGQKHHGVMIPELGNPNQINNTKLNAKPGNDGYPSRPRRWSKRNLLKLQKKDILSSDYGNHSNTSMDKETMYDSTAQQSYMCEKSESFHIKAKACVDDDEEGFELIYESNPVVNNHDYQLKSIDHICGLEVHNMCGNQENKPVFDERNDIEFENRAENQIEVRCESSDEIVRIPTKDNQQKVKFVLTDLTYN